MTAWHNATGSPLSAAKWLEAHHRAKLPERTAFAARLARYAPTRLVDLGCATGLWLDLLDRVMPADCEFVGIDTDPEALEIAQARARKWARPTTFVCGDISADPALVPTADLVLAFNVLGYLDHPTELLEHLRHVGGVGRIAVRQYDGSTIRLGPLPTAVRFAVDASLQETVLANGQVSHYALDRTYDAIRGSGFRVEHLEFETFERHDPFPDDFVGYLEGTVEWMKGYLADDARQLLEAHFAPNLDCRYFAAVDLVGLLAAPTMFTRPPRV